jgi:diguanylate cyclase (GGDEF)-like protein
MPGWRNQRRSSFWKGRNASWRRWKSSRDRAQIQSKIAESRSLVNLSDIKLRGHRYKEAFEIARQSLGLAVELDDTGLASTSKANMGFALFGLGRVYEGSASPTKRLRATSGPARRPKSPGCSANTAISRTGRRSQGGACAAASRTQAQRRDRLAAHERTVLELQEKYESDKRRREIELLNRENELKTAELRSGTLQQRAWWMLAGLFGFSFVVVAILYRKLRTTNQLLGDKNRELSFQSSRDPLTALYNRRYFQDFIGDAGGQEERRRAGGKLIEALVLLDLDHFKEINDRYGHAAGDSVLVAVAERLRETLRETDMIVRWGGEEFLVFVAATHAGKLDEIALRIMHAVYAEPFVWHGASIPMTASIGFAQRRRRRGRNRCRGSARSALPTWRFIWPRSTAVIAATACSSWSTTTTEPLPRWNTISRLPGAADWSTCTSLRVPNSPQRALRRTRSSAWPHSTDSPKIPSVAARGRGQHAVLIC